MKRLQVVMATILTAILVLMVTSSAWAQPAPRHQIGDDEIVIVGQVEGEHWLVRVGLNVDIFKLVHRFGSIYRLNTRNEGEERELTWEEFWSYDNNRAILQARCFLEEGNSGNGKWAPVGAPGDSSVFRDSRCKSKWRSVILAPYRLYKVPWGSTITESQQLGCYGEEDLAKAATCFADKHERTWRRNRKLHARAHGASSPEPLVALFMLSDEELHGSIDHDALSPFGPLSVPFWRLIVPSWTLMGVVGGVTFLLGVGVVALIWQHGEKRTVPNVVIRELQAQLVKFQQEHDGLEELRRDYARAERSLEANKLEIAQLAAEKADANHRVNQQAANHLARIAALCTEKAELASANATRATEIIERAKQYTAAKNTLEGRLSDLETKLSEAEARLRRAADDQVQPPSDMVSAVMAIRAATRPPAVETYALVAQLDGTPRGMRIRQLERTLVNVEGERNEAYQQRDRAYQDRDDFEKRFFALTRAVIAFDARIKGYATGIEVVRNGGEVKDLVNRFQDLIERYSNMIVACVPSRADDVAGLQTVLGYVFWPPRANILVAAAQ